MNVEIDGININYEIKGEGKDIFLFHGWGTDITTYRGLIDFLALKNRVICLDMPGFGLSDDPPVAWNVPEYSEFARKFIDVFRNNATDEKPILMGHSFGGRVIIYMVANKLVNAKKLVLFASAGIKPKRGIKYYVKVYSYKMAKKISESKILKGKFKDFAEKHKNKAGSGDYRNAKGVMRETFVKVVNFFVKDILHKVDVSTLLIWGENDTATPVADGKVMEKLIPDAGLVVLKNAGHYAFAEKHYEFCLIVDNFISGS